MVSRYLLISLSLVTFDLAYAQEVDVQSHSKARVDSSVSVGADSSISVQSSSKAATESSVRVDTVSPISNQPKRELTDHLPAKSTTPLTSNTSVIVVDSADARLSAAQKPQPPIPCKQKVEAISDSLRITIINNYCIVKITIQKLWREGGKTRVQFEADNTKGGQQANLQMVEQWTDQSGRIVADPINEQPIAIAKHRNTIFSISGPTPAAITATITLNR